MGACTSKNAVKKAPSDDSSTDRESLFTAVETDDEQFLRANGAAEVEGGRLSISPSAAGGEVPETFTNPSPRSAGEASAGAASL